MAERTLIKDGAGAIGQMPDISLVDGKLTEKMALTLGGKVQELIRRVNKGWSLGTGTSGHMAGNLDAQYIDFVFPSVADTEVVIPHGLGRKPIGYDVVRRDAACSVYDSSIGSWSDTLLYLKCDTGSVTVRLRVF